MSTSTEIVVAQEPYARLIQILARDGSRGANYCSLCAALINPVADQEVAFTPGRESVLVEITGRDPFVLLATPQECEQIQPATDAIESARPGETMRAVMWDFLGGRERPII